MLLCSAPTHSVAKPSSPERGQLWMAHTFQLAHLSARRPIQQATISRKGFYSMALQCVCDADTRLVDGIFGSPGVCHGGRIWGESQAKPCLAALNEQGQTLDFNGRMCRRRCWQIQHTLAPTQ